MEVVGHKLKRQNEEITENKRIGNKKLMTFQIHFLVV